MTEREYKIGWGTHATYYHKVRRRTGSSPSWTDCNGWARRPHDDATEALAMGLKPCPRCFKAGKR